MKLVWKHCPILRNIAHLCEGEIVRKKDMDFFIGMMIARVSCRFNISKESAASMLKGQCPDFFAMMESIFRGETSALDSRSEIFDDLYDSFLVPFEVAT